VYRWGNLEADQLLGSVDVSRFQDPKLMQSVTMSLVEHDASQDSATRKWFKNQTGDWHWVTPDGSVYRWGNLGADQFVGGVGVSRWHKPKLMQTATLDVVTHDTSQDSATQKWFQNQTGWWHYVTSDGSVYRWGNLEADQLVGGVEESRFRKPKLLQKVTINITQYFPADDSASKKWFRDNGNDWHYLTPEGGVYRWGNLGPDVLLGGVKADYFSKPNNLVIDY
jgi:hypothetical protein